MVTGGAGYIGAHVVRSLQAIGHKIVVVDNLSTGHAEVVPGPVPLRVCSVGDAVGLRDVFGEFDVRGVVHLAALKNVEESEHDPARYFLENVGGTATLLQAARDAGASWFLLSSTAAVYGIPESDGVGESDPLRPESAYGESKLACEWMLRRAGRAYGLRWATLRYFNVVGAADPTLGDRGTANLFPRVLQSLATGEAPVIFGDDYPTRDGTCIRDYIDVSDLADAHAVTAAALEHGSTEAVYNVGTGRGASVREVIDIFAAVTQGLGQPVVRSRRIGDPAAVVADPGRLNAELGWRANRTLADSVRTSWEAWRWRRQ